MKAIRKIRRSNIIKVEDNFATLQEFDQDGQATYEFCYVTNVLEALRAGISGVRIKVRAQETSKAPGIFEEPNLQNSNISLQRSVIVDNILLNQGRQRDTKDANQFSVIKTIFTDITTIISNEVLSTRPDKIFTEDDFKSRTVFKIATVDELKNVNNQKPIHQHSSLKYQLKKKKTSVLNVGSIIKDKVDPSEAIQRKVVVSTKKAFAGTLSPAVENITLKTSQIEPLLSDILDTPPIINTNNLNGNVSVPYLQSEKQISSTVRKVAVIDSRSLDMDDFFYATFEVLGKGGLVVERLEKKVPHGKNVKIFNTPVLPPKVNVSKAGLIGRNIMEIKQEDPNADTIRMFRKTIYPTKRLEDLNYEFVKDIEIENNDGIKKIVDATSNVNNVIYRFISISSEDQVSSEFTNVVANGVPTREFRKSENLLFAAVFATIGEEGIDVNVSNISPGVTAIKVLKRDLTIRQTTFDIVPHAASESLVYLLDGEEDPGTFTDKSVKTGHIYDYCVKLIFEDGLEEIATGCDSIEFRAFSEGAVDISVDEPNLIDREGGLDVAFRISTNLQDGDTDYLKNLLDKHGFSDLYSQEINDDKNFFKKLIAHSIRRIDLTTGESQFFKTFTGNFFSDQDNSKLSSISPLESGHRYRYVVTPLFRDPRSLFKNTTETNTIRDSVTADFSPLKFLHPITSQKGNLVSVTSLNRNYPQDSMEFGIIGASQSVDITLEEENPRITNGKAIRFNRNTNLVRWQIIGSKNKIDHFIIIMTRMGQEEVVGKAHASFDGDFIEFIDKLDNGEIGYISYKIIPVFTSYEYGTALLTNRIIVN